jgi:endonuclease/exonuclease/phosphatase family metal-dependent hydrolase
VNVHLALPVSSNVAKMLDPSQLYADERRRRPQVRGLVENLPVDRPAVVCGDFNTPPNTAVYRTLSSALDNSFWKAGTGLGLTYPRRFPLVRIDHIFVSRDIKPVRCWTLDIDASNHKPLCADLQMPD